MPMLPPLVQDAPLDDPPSSTSRPVASRMVRTQRRYASNFNISFVYEPPKPIPKLGFPAPESTFDKWRADAAELDPTGGGAGGLPGSAARGEAPAAGTAAPPRRRLHDVLLGTTAVVLLGVLGGIGITVWTGSVPGATAPKGSGIAAWAQPLADVAVKAVTRAAPDRIPVPLPGKEAADVPPSQPAAALPLPSTPPERLALAAPSANKPAVAGPLLPASNPMAMTADAVPLAEPAAPRLVPPVKLPEADAAPPAPALWDAMAEAAPAPGQAAQPPPAASPEPAAAPPAPAMAAATVRLPPASEWTEVAVSKLASLPEAAALPLALPAPSAVAAPPAGPAAPAADMARAVPPGVDAQQVVSTMELVQQMSLLVHDMHGEGVRYRTEVTALTGAVQAKAAGLEERLKLAEARSAAGADAGDGGGSRAAGGPAVLRGYRVQAGSPGAAVLSDAGAGPERVARLLVMVGDQLPGAGRVTGIVQRGGSWIVRTERGVIQ